MKTYDVIIEKIIPGGQGLAHINNKAVFIPDVVPGEKVRIRITEDKGSYCRGTVQEIVNRSAQRRNPPCPLSTSCGGCCWQHIEYTAQREFKIALMHDILSRENIVEYPHIYFVSDEELGYRNRAQFHKNSSGALGFMAAKSRNVIPLKECPVLSTDLNQFLKTPYYGNAKRISVFGYNGLVINDETAFNETITLTILDQQISFSINNFFQSNICMLIKLLQTIKQQLDGETLLDLYAGVGLYGAFFKNRCKKIVAVEENISAIAYAEKNLSGIEHALFGMRVEEWIKLERINEADTIIVNPPRTGLSKSVTNYLLKSGSPTILYISCNPVTLARDLKTLVKGKYSFDKLTLFDFYPQTSYIESLAILKINT